MTQQDKTSIEFWKHKKLSKMNHQEGEKLCDGRSFTLALEEQYREMWQKWCEKQKNSSFAGKSPV